MIRSVLFSPGPGLFSTTAAFPVNVPGRLPHCLFRGLLDVHTHYGLSVRGIAVTILSIEGFGDIIAAIAAPIATGWSDPLPDGYLSH